MKHKIISFHAKEPIINVVAYANHMCDDIHCMGAFVNIQTRKIERCDTCKIFSCDAEAVHFVMTLLQPKWSTNA